MQILATTWGPVLFVTVFSAIPLTLDTNKSCLMKISSFLGWQILFFPILKSGLKKEAIGK